MTLRKQEDTGSSRRKLKIALFGELSLEEAMDLSRDRQILDLTLPLRRASLYSPTIFGLFTRILIMVYA
jgi:hypothetical protein